MRAAACMVHPRTSSLKRSPTTASFPRGGSVPSTTSTPPSEPASPASERPQSYPPATRSAASSSTPRPERCAKWSRTRPSGSRRAGSLGAALGCFERAFRASVRLLGGGLFAPGFLQPVGRYLRAGVCLLGVRSRRLGACLGVLGG